MRLSQSSTALNELTAALASQDDAARSGTLDKITDLFLAGAPGFSDAHVAVFDQVIGLLSDAIEVRARARLSEKLADVMNAPAGVVRKLSRDEIAVARPVLARSPKLTEKDLVEAARLGGRDHMLAISERRDLSEPVTDVLVHEGDRVVINAVASNPSARFSIKGYDTLIAKSRADELLQAALGRRGDIPQRHMSVLFELAKTAARERLQGELDNSRRRAVSKAVDQSARDIATETLAKSEAYRLAMQDVTALVQQNELNEAVVIDYGKRSKIDHVIVAVSYLSKLPLQMAERAVLSSDNDMLLIISRSINFSWSTVKVLFNMRVEHRPGTRQLEQLAENYAKLTQATAQRVLQFLHARETAAAAKI